MKTKIKCSIFLALITHFSLLILISSTVSAGSVQNSSVVEPYEYQNSSIIGLDTYQNSSVIKSYAYIASSDTDTVAVIDTTTNNVTNIVDIETFSNTSRLTTMWGGEDRPYGVAVTPDGTEVYVTNSGSCTVSVIDTATNSLISIIDVKGYPYGVAVNPTGEVVYVTSDYRNEDADYSIHGIVSVIDTATKTVTATIRVGKNPYGIAVNPDGTDVYVVNKYSNTISVVDTTTNKFKATIPLGENSYSYGYGYSYGPGGIAITPDGRKLYVTINEDYDGSVVFVIDTSNNTITGKVTGLDGLSGIAVNPTGTKVYVAGGHTVSVIDTATNIVADTVTVGKGSEGIAVTPDGKKVYVTNSDSDTVSVIDTATDTVITTVNAGSSPSSFGQFIGPVPSKRVLPVANFNSNVTSGYAPLSVRFTDLSENTTSLFWNFGDGKNSTERSPVNVYATSGNYTVNLTAINGNGTDSKFATITVLKQQVIPLADFNSNVTSGYAPLTVQFKDLSENSTGWNWNFGDGVTSTEQNPMHTYSTAGNYFVNLTATNEDSIDSKLAAIVVQEKLEASNISSPITVQIGNLSQNAKTINWSIGPSPFDSDFNGSEINVYAPIIVKIDNLLQNATTINWIFG